MQKCIFIQHHKYDVKTTIALCTYSVQTDVLQSQELRQPTAENLQEEAGPPIRKILWISYTPTQSSAKVEVNRFVRQRRCCPAGRHLPRLDYNLRTSCMHAHIHTY